MKTFLYIDTIRRLGFLNVAYVAWYRFTLKYGIRKRLFPQRSFTVNAAFYRPVVSSFDYPCESKEALFDSADKIIQGQLRYYAHHWKTVGNPPNWFLNPFNSRIWLNPQQHWTSFGDFNTGVGDIKNVWEASRFEWTVTLARAYAVSGKMIYLHTLNQWLNDWAEKNPINTGPNWKCGQEAAIRVFNLIHAALILRQWDNPNPVLTEFIHGHLERISANIAYAMAQDNNHGTSEAAALFIGGHWGARNTFLNHVRKRCDHFARQGRKWLENRVEKLVEEDGSFSQHSVTYHRVLLDTLIFAEYWRRKFTVDPFSEMFYRRTKAVIHWMIMLSDAPSGAAPNLGGNDGALFLNTHACDYRDFRPSIQTASVLFHGYKHFAPGPWDEPGYWFGLNDKGGKGENEEGNRNSPHVIPVIDRKKASQVFPGGYVVMVGQESWGMLRFPMYRFRPGHNDVFHVDLWYRGENICRDGGSYSYNREDDANNDYFESVKAHNTVCFDDYEQMPRLGRFLLGQWLSADHIGAIKQDADRSQHWSGAYRDYRGNRHQRRITWKEDTWIIEDRFSGAFKKAEMIYRLIPDSYRLEGNRVTASWGIIEISGTACDIEMSKGLESLYYWQKQPVDTLVLRNGKNCEKISTRFVFGR